MSKQGRKRRLKTEAALHQSASNRQQTDAYVGEVMSKKNKTHADAFEQSGTSPTRVSEVRQ